MALNSPVSNMSIDDNSNERTNSDIFKVIEAVKSRPVIWKSYIYGDGAAQPDTVDAHWAALYEEIDPAEENTPQYYRLLWNRVRKSLESQFPSDLLIEHYRRNWKYFKEMEFYYYELCAKRYKSNYNNPVEDEPEEPEEDEEETETNYANMSIGKEHAELVWRYILLKNVDNKTAPGDQLLELMDTICDTALNQLSRKQQ